jgi:uncharacterized protein (TIGR02452 family)
MSRSRRAEQAQETVAIVERGTYVSAGGRPVDITESVRACLDTTRFYAPEELEQLRQQVLDQHCAGSATALEVVNETTLTGVARLLSWGQGPVAVLNFASARNPGGGFLSGPSSYF